MSGLLRDTVDFVLPASLEAHEPPEIRGHARDEVKLMVASSSGITHAKFADLAEHLDAGDVVVFNDSATLPAAVEGSRSNGEKVVVHFSTELRTRQWMVEVRPAVNARGPAMGLQNGEIVSMTGGVVLVLDRARTHRLWEARVDVDDVVTYLHHHGHPIRYSYVTNAYSLNFYDTVFGRVPGSAEMPSAARPFTERVVLALVAKGVVMAPVTLHTGVSSLETGEVPYAERFAVPSATAALVNDARCRGSRVVAVGTTVTRALESTVGSNGIEGRTGWTDLVLGPKRPARVVNGLITGWHAPGATHLALLQSVAGDALVATAYDEALAHRYLWHEFGDSCLLLP